MWKTDEENVVFAVKIATYLQTRYGIDAERCSIYKDIREINVVNLMLADGCTFFEVGQTLEDDEELALIRYKKRKENSDFYICSKNRSMSFSLNGVISFVRSLGEGSTMPIQGFFRTVSSIIACL